MRGDNFKYPIWPMEVALWAGSVLEEKKRAIHCALKFCTIRSA